MLVCEEALEVSDLPLQLFILSLDLLAFESLQAGEPHVEDSLCLDLSEAKTDHQLFLGVVVCRADGRDDFVDIVECDDESFEDVSPGLCFGEVESRSSCDYDLLMLEVLFEDLPEVEYPRLSVDERQHDHAERGLQSGVLVQSVQDDIRIDIFLQLDDDPGSFSVGLVSDSRDAFDPLVSYKVCHRLDEPCLVDLERDLGYDDPHPSVSVLLDLAYGSYEDFALTGEISFPCGLLAEDHCSCREVRSLDYIDKLVDVAVRLVDELDTCVDSLAEVVRRDRCRHTNGDTVRAVDQEVRYS